ncbi:MAG: HEAT repeat domain-containing protein [Candidatus Freyarchaeum deiterrae]
MKESSLSESDIERMEAEKDVKGLIKALSYSFYIITEKATEALAKIGEPAVEFLVLALKDDYWLVRQGAANALGNIRDKRAVEPLIQALKDKDMLVLRGAIEALGKIGDERAVQVLIHSLNDERFDIREEAVLALRNIGKPALDYLIQALKNENWFIRWGAARALGYIKDERAVKPLNEALKDEKWEIRMAAAISLEKIINERAEERLNQVLKDKIDVYVFERLKLIEGIIKRYTNRRSYSDYDFQEDFLRFDPIEYEMIMEKIGYHSDLCSFECKENRALFRDAMKELFNYMISDDNKVRIEAIKVFTNAQSEVSHPESCYSDAWEVKDELNEGMYRDAVIDAMGNEDSEIREAAKKAIKGFSVYAKFPALYPLLKSENPYIRRNVRETLLDAVWAVYHKKSFNLEKFQEFINYLIEAAVQEDDDLRAEIAYKLIDIGFDEYTEILIKKLGNGPNEWIRKFTHETLREDLWFVPEEAIEDLKSLIKNPNPEVRKDTAEKMAAYWDTFMPEQSSFTESLIEALRDEEQSIRQAALESLGILGVEQHNVLSLAEALKTSETETKKDTKPLDLFINMLKSEKTQIRRLAVCALGRLEDPAAIETLNNLLKDEDLSVQEATILALASFPPKYTLEILRSKLYDPKSRIRMAAVEALLKMGGVQSVRQLKKALKDKDKLVRMTAEYGMRYIQ